ncbi:outer membrane protein assembly factor BamD [bacterium]|nr:outer membrane protein assembly factor BamD [bacterium]
MQYYRNLFIFILIIIGLITGCNRHTVNLKNMTPEQQYQHAKSLFDKEDYYKSKLEFSIIVINNPGHVIIEGAQFYLAESHYFEKEYILAIEEYEKLIRSIPQSEFVDDARLKIGLAYSKLSPSFHLDQDYTRKAIMEYRTFLEEYATSDLKSEAEKYLEESVNKLAMKEFYAGELYRKMGYHRSALISFVAVIEEYPATEMAKDSYYWKAECHRTMGDLEDAESTYLQLIQLYPDHKMRAKSEKRLREIREVLAKYTIE